jgi:hypothetical protein
MAEKVLVGTNALAYYSKVCFKQKKVSQLCPTKGKKSFEHKRWMATRHFDY